MATSYKLYERHLLLHTNASSEVRPLTVRVKTAPLPIERREISYVQLVVMFLTSLVTVLFQFFAFSSFGTLMGVGSVVLMGVGSVVGFHGGRVWALRVSYAVSGLSVALPVASFLVKGLTVGIFTLKYVSPLVTVFFGGSLMMGNPVARAVGARMSWEGSVGNVLNGRLQLLSTGLGTSVGIGCVIGFFNPYILLALAATGLPLFTILLYPPFKQHRLIAKYRQSEKRLIKP